MQVHTPFADGKTRAGVTYSANRAIFTPDQPLNWTFNRDAAGSHAPLHRAVSQHCRFATLEETNLLQILEQLSPEMSLEVPTHSFKVDTKPSKP